MKSFNYLVTWEERIANGGTTDRVVSAMKALRESYKNIFTLPTPWHLASPILSSVSVWEGEAGEAPAERGLGSAGASPSLTNALPNPRNPRNG